MLDTDRQVVWMQAAASTLPPERLKCPLE
jgi:hypothetical protein